MAIDVSKLNEKELLKLRDRVEKALASFAKRRKDDARKAAEAAAKKHGFSLGDLVGASAPRGKAKKAGAPAKYRNPDDASQTWSGRGRQPAWYKAAMAKGTDPRKLEI